MVDAFKGRWKAKLFAKDAAPEAPPEDPRPKTQTSFKLNDDVNEYAPFTLYPLPTASTPLQTLLTARL